MVDGRSLALALGFSPKDGAIGVFQKKYTGSGGYTIEVDFEKEAFDYGKKIKTESKTTLNFSQGENWVIFECVDRLLEKGYQPQNLILEKTWPSGHGTSGRLDILVTRADGSAYMMIECKTFGTEYDKALKRLYKDGGQLFAYFQQDKSADIIMLYASELKGKSVVYNNEIVKIEEDYRFTANVKDLHDRWNKLPKSNGVFDAWVSPYDFRSKALTKQDLKAISDKDSSFIFNRFLEILRHNVVSDKPNAFNKIFTLFLCKIIDEFKGENEELHFQFLEGQDDHVSFQKRLTDLYQKGMRELLEKNVTDISDAEIELQFQGSSYIEEFKRMLTKIRLEKNNEFAIKEVFDHDSFSENAKVVKEVVELLQGFQIRYNYRQQFLSDFFEKLLTTGLKQESGQFFTPVPVARFIIKSLPIQDITAKKIAAGNTNDLLPNIIDYAAGSGHFLTESMEELQKYIESIDISKLNPNTVKKLKAMRAAQFDWAVDYVYGIEKDYRLVKTTKVSCYLHGDGLANIIHGDGLGHFSKAKEYKAKLKAVDPKFKRDNKQFDVIVSNPPYSVSAFKGTLSDADESFELYDRLTDQSSEIECLFVERTKQLLKDGGIAGVILPSSILSNTGIYTRTREIILQYFEIVAIAELGSNTFMATGTNTVVLFLRRRNNYESKNIRDAVKKTLADQRDNTINGIEHPITHYINHVWEGITLADYMTLLSKQPNEAVQNHDIYKEYSKKIITKAKDDKWKRILDGEEEKLFYFILAYHQKVVLVKTGEKNDEKAFLGYEFSNRRGNEGIHPIQRGKSIDECTRLFDPEVFDNPEKASTYIYKAFQGQYDIPNPALAANIHHLRLIDMLTFDRLDFEKKININASTKVKLESRFPSALLETLATFQSGLWKGETEPLQRIKVLRNTNFNLNNGKLNYSDVEEIDVEVKQFQERTLEYGDIIVEKSGGSDTQAIGRVVLFNKKDTNEYSYSNFCTRVRVIDNKILNPVYLWLILHDFYRKGGTISLQNGVRLLNIDMEGYKKIKIPLPPLDTQNKIVAEIEVLEEKERKGKDSISKSITEINDLISRRMDGKKPLNYFLSEINPSKSDVIEEFAPDTEVSFLGMEDVSNDGKIIALQKRKLAEVKNGYTFFQNGDVLLAKITPCMENGKGALISGLTNNIGFGSTEFFVLRSSDRILPRILFYITQNKEFRAAAEKVMTGASGHRRVPKSFVENYMVFDIPLSEQQKIVSQIEAIEKQIAALEAELASLPQQKEQVLKKWL